MSLRQQAINIWQAGVEAVDSKRLVQNALWIDGNLLYICGERVPLEPHSRVVVAGGGKAGAGMATAVESQLANDLGDRLTGWVNVPADCVESLQHIHLHAARPAGHNEPTAEGVAGTREILNRVSELGADDVCLVLLSGGGSALLPAPVPEVGLSGKQAVTSLLMKSGATIQELNAVRQNLSLIKGGNLAKAITAGQTHVLTISDVVGDPLSTIASGPTVPATATPQDALDILNKYDPEGEKTPVAVRDSLTRKAAESRSNSEAVSEVHNHIIGNNETAMKAAQKMAEKLGFQVYSLGSANEGIAADEGRKLAKLALQLRDHSALVKPPVCILSGGEPVVPLTKTEAERKGGRNQELVLAALQELWGDGLRKLVVLSGGTDGEDGPTDAAGAVADAQLLQNANQQQLRPDEFLAINNSYPFFEQTDGLLKTGPTHTNVMDLRVVLVAK